MMNQCALTTFDNPFNPFDQFESWFLFDLEKGYNSLGRLARTANISEDMTDKEYLEETERAIDEIILYDYQNIYKKLKKEVRDPVETD